ncbi:MAG: triose-phosphate isomerase [Sulfurimonas sp.]|jgi:triosephosphate isomerase|nr:triose-phosphate isomerase [Sulfurimonadaceae bacterium]
MIFAANFKTNLTRSKTKEYIEKLDSLVDGSDEIFVFPPATALLSSSKHITVGVQNAYMAKNGAFTGEIGLEQLEEFGCKTILLGHSERRHILGESQEDIAKKFEFFKEQGFSIIYCVGEKLEDRANAMEFIKTQYKDIDTNYEKLIVAYEPVWAIGSGLTPTTSEIEQIHSELKKLSKAPLLYGGSVNVKNAKEILALSSVDGVLVGGASLEVESFYNIINQGEK